MADLVVPVKTSRLHPRQETLSATVNPQIKLECFGVTLGRNVRMIVKYLLEHFLNIARIIQIVVLAIM